MRNRLLTLALIATLALGLWTPSTLQAQALPQNAAAGGTLQNAATALGNGSSLDTSSATAVVFQVSISVTATVTFEGSVGSSLWNSLTCFTLDSQTSSSSVTATGIVRCNVLGIPLVRARISSYGSGTVTVLANASAAALASIRDDTGPSGAISGQLRGTQATAPTCAKTVLGSAGAAGGTCYVTGTDSFMRGLIGGGWSQSTGGPANVTVTFNTPYAAAPSCVATWDGTATYRYYVYAVTPTTTTAQIKLGGVNGVAQVASWSPGDNFNLICAGVQ